MKSLSDVMAGILAKRKARTGLDPLEPDPPVLEVEGVDPVCWLCHGLGWLRRDLDVTDPEFGKLVRCPDCFGPATEQKRQQAVWDPLPPNLQQKPLDGFPGSPEALALCWRYVAQALDEDCEMPWAILYGPKGTGKTTLASGMAVELRKKRPPLGLIFETVPDLLDKLRAAYAPNSEQTFDERLEQLKAVDILVLDDLGTQRSTPWASEKLYQILNDRYQTRKLTLITSNIELSRLANDGDDNISRIADRIMELALVIPVLKPNIRALIAMQRAQQTS